MYKGRMQPGQAYDRRDEDRARVWLTWDILHIHQPCASYNGALKTHCFYCNGSASWGDHPELQVTLVHLTAGNSTRVVLTTDVLSGN